MGDKKPQRTESSMIFKPDDFPLKASIDYELPLQGGFKIKLKAQKPSHFTIKQARLRLVGDHFWNVISKLFGPRIIASFKLAFHPLYLCPDILDPSSFKSSNEKLETELIIGARYNHFSISKRLWWIVLEGDPIVRFEIESGKKNVKWVKQHLILNWEFKFSEVLKQCNIPKPPIDVLRALTSYPIPDNLDQIKLDSDKNNNNGSQMGSQVGSQMGSQVGSELNKKKEEEDKKKQEEEKKRNEEKKKQEEEKRKQEEEKKKQEEEKRKQEEEKRKQEEEKKKSEEERKKNEDERKRNEEKRKQEEEEKRKQDKKKQEEERRREEERKRDDEDLTVDDLEDSILQLSTVLSADKLDSEVFMSKGSIRAKASSERVRINLDSIFDPSKSIDNDPKNDSNNTNTIVNNNVNGNNNGNNGYFNQTPHKKKAPLIAQIMAFQIYNSNSNSNTTKTENGNITNANNNVVKEKTIETKPQDSKPQDSKAQDSNKQSDVKVDSNKQSDVKSSISNIEEKSQKKLDKQRAQERHRRISILITQKAQESKPSKEPVASYTPIGNQPLALP